MAVLCIAIGNALRGDDGVGHRVLDLLANDQVLRRSVVQLAPELAAEIAGVDTVLFIDADVTCAEPRVEPLVRNPIRGTLLSHTVSASEIVGLAERLYGFTGSSLTCRVPARDFESPNVLSAWAEECARSAAEMIRERLLRPLLCRRTRDGSACHL